jgi:hypothetical protein
MDCEKESQGRNATQFISGESGERTKSIAALRSLLYWDVTQRKLVVSHRRFGTTYRSHLQGPQSKKTAWPLKTIPTGCPETAVTYYPSTLRNIPDERRSHLHRAGSLQSLTAALLEASRALSARPSDSSSLILKLC